MIFCLYVNLISVGRDSFKLVVISCKEDDDHVHHAIGKLFGHICSDFALNQVPHGYLAGVELYHVSNGGNAALRSLITYYLVRSRESHANNNDRLQKSSQNKISCAGAREGWYNRRSPKASS